MIEIGTPTTPAEIDEYFALRWQILREPWQQPLGSERDEFDASLERTETQTRDAAARRATDARPVIHATARDASGQLIGVGRVHFNSADEAQIRYMATIEAKRSQGVGRAIAEHLERRARAQGARVVVLNARASAVSFYSTLGYEAIGDAPTLFGAIPHTRMEKRLNQ